MSTLYDGTRRYYARTPPSESRWGLPDLAYRHYRDDSPSTESTIQPDTDESVFESALPTRPARRLPLPITELDPSPFIPEQFETMPGSFPLPTHHRDVKTFLKVLKKLKDCMANTTLERTRTSKINIRCVARLDGRTREEQPSLPVVIILAITKQQIQRRTWQSYDGELRSILYEAFGSEKTCPPIRYYLVERPQSQGDYVPQLLYDDPYGGNVSDGEIDWVDARKEVRRRERARDEEDDTSDSTIVGTTLTGVEQWSRTSPRSPRFPDGYRYRSP